MILLNTLPPPPAKFRATFGQFDDQFYLNHTRSHLIKNILYIKTFILYFNIKSEKKVSWLTSVYYFEFLF